MYDPKTIKAENNQRSLLKIVDGGHILADHSFDHMSHNSKDSPQNAYTNVERDMVNIFFQKISQAFLYSLDLTNLDLTKCHDLVNKCQLP